MLETVAYRVFLCVRVCVCVLLFDWSLFLHAYTRLRLWAVIATPCVDRP